MQMRGIRAKARMFELLKRLFNTFGGAWEDVPSF